uniref:Coiled-coil domain-containing protein 138 n=1 Tax=Ciona savignyi TaxID=51511 RepID=H2YZL0_CIOSA
EREHELEMREESVRMREDALAEEEASVRREHEVMIRLQGVESEVQEKFEILREHHSDEMNRVSAALTDKLKDMKRLKNSFDIIKTQNDDIKQQVCELTQQNKKLTSQNIKLKKRCENLQRKNDYNAQKKNTEKSFVQIQSKPIPQEKSPKVTVYKHCLSEITTLVLKVWSSFGSARSQLRHLVNTSEPRVLHISKENVGDNCLKVLPLLVEVVRHLPSFTSQPKHQLPYIRFIYWALHHLEDTHHALLSSTARRLGEELMRSSPSKQVMEMSSAFNSTLQSSIGGDGKTRINSFFRSSNHEVRMLSSLIILKTLHQVDMLAQVYDQLKQDLKDERCRETFLEYSATHAILPFMTYKTNKALVGSAVDVMLQMAMESPLLPSFLDLCSCEPWFRAVASCLRSATTEQSTLEKLSIILQKLSKIKSNKKLFDSFSLGRLLQDKHRECDPDNTFLSLNLRSILFNLNLIK